MRKTFRGLSSLLCLCAKSCLSACQPGPAPPRCLSSLRSLRYVITPLCRGVIFKNKCKMCSDTPPRPQKRKHRQQKYRREWEEANQWLDRVPEDDYKANCKACRRTFSVSHGGLSDVKQHAAGDLHSRNIRTQRSQAPVSQFFIAETSPEIDSV